MYELVILAYLAQRQANGYQILKVVNDAIGPFARLSKGRFYPLLSQLEERGFIRAVPAAGSGRTYTVTRAGRRRLEELLVDTEAYPGNYQRVFTLKAMVLDMLSPRRRRALVEHYRAYCLANIRHLAAEADELERTAAEGSGPPLAGSIARVMRHQLRRWELELELVAQLERETKTLRM
jgi:DNA-binding PadR family transcriptional regulator